MKTAVTVGVLALQGAFAKHAEALRSLGVIVKEVRKPKDLAECQGLVIPGGESTAILKHIQYIGLEDAFQEFMHKKPVFGTCAGLILMSSEVISDPLIPFKLIDVSVQRNAFGRQADSFRTNVELTLNPKKTTLFPAIFIRAPRIVKVLSPKVQVLATLEGEAILVQEGIHLGATFHPELTPNREIHSYFLRLIQEA